MPTHWTYATIEPESGLFQGDIIAREPLLEVLHQVHNHFCDPKYLAFIVLTQTCDLVLRKGVCKARHISLAVVRPLSAILPEFISDICRSPFVGILPKERKTEVEQFLHRVLNQNEQAQGWVYLHPDGDVGIGEPAVAMLRISISLRASEHYELIRSARRGRLGTEYRNKLGWLKGNLYSRIDTTDWAEANTDTNEERKVVEDLIDCPIGDEKPRWVPTRWIDEAKKKNLDLSSVPLSEAYERLKANASPPPLDIALTETTKVIESVKQDITEKVAGEYSELMDKDECIPVLLAVAVFQAICTHLTGREAEVLNALILDTELKFNVLSVLKTHTRGFLKRQGPRKFDIFIESIDQLQIINENAIAQIKKISMSGTNGECHGIPEQLEQILSTFVTPPALASHLRAMCLMAMQATLSERVTAKLRNNMHYQRAVKPD